MELWGKEYGFLLSVGAEQEIARLCPEGDLRRLGELLRGRTADTIGLSTEIVCILSRWHEKARRFREPDYKETPLTRELILMLPVEEFARVQNEALRAMLADRTASVEAEAEKKGVAPK